MIGYALRRLICRKIGHNVSMRTDPPWCLRCHRYSKQR